MRERISIPLPRDPRLSDFDEGLEIDPWPNDIILELDPISGWLYFPNGDVAYIVDLYRLAKMVDWIKYSGSLQFFPFDFNYDGDFVYIADLKLFRETFSGYIYYITGIAQRNGFESKQLDILERVW